MRSFQFWAASALLLVTVVTSPALGKPRTTTSRYSNEEDDPLTDHRTITTENEGSTCGYNGCHATKEGALNVHLIAHTHDDVGWLKTVDQYYYGSNTKFQKAGVQYILDSVIDELMKDPNRRFVYVETAFFWKWWGEQDDQRRHHVKRLVNEGRLQFSGGAWSMNDEATTHYQSIIDQFTWGLRKLNDTFGDCGRPRTGWQIDPFGHSREMANIFAMAGYDGLLLGRSDYQDRQNRMLKQEAEMIWKGSDDLGQSSDLFTGIMYNTYSPPPGFCFDILCSDEPFIDDITSPDYNVDKMVEKFLNYTTRQAAAYQTDQLIMTMGDDFNYQNARIWFKNLDKLIKYVNKAEPKINLLYSTPSCYVKALHDSKGKWPTKEDDFFPYASDPNSYWTGYFTSRPTLKYFERKSNNFLQVCKQLYAMTNLNEKDKVDLNMLRSAMGVMQHHDAVTGTEKQHVAMDYARMLEQGVQDCLITTREALNKLMSEKPNPTVNTKTSKDQEGIRELDAPYMPLNLCKLNVSECETTEKSNTFVVTVYNPLGHVVDYYASVPVTGTSFSVRDSTGTEMATQIQPISEHALQQLSDRQSNATSELIFYIPILPPLGYKSFYVTSPQREPALNNEVSKGISFQDVDEKMQADAKGPVIIDSRQGATPNLKMSGVSTDKMVELASNLAKAKQNEQISIGNEGMQITVDPTTGLINFLVFTSNGTTTKVPLKQELLYYEGMVGNNEIAQNRSSGAYIFRPKGTDAYQLTSKPNNSVSKGPLVEELHQKFSSWASQVVRVYKHSNLVEFEWLVGPIPVADNVGKEVVSRFTTDLKTQGVFYTDSNGRQMLKRVLNKRPTWPLELSEPVAGNYYPVTSMISIEDSASGREFFVLNDRAQGGSSLRDGEVELMVHRRLLRDDAFGVDEALNEKGDSGLGLVAKGKHYVFFGNEKQKIRDTTPMAISKQLALQKLLEPVIFVSPADNLTFAHWNEARNEFSGLSAELPANVHLMTLEPWKDNTVLLRLEHILQKSDDPAVLSRSVKVNIGWLFSGIQVQSIRETTLAANQFLEDSTRFQWDAKTEETSQGETYEKRMVEALQEEKQKYEQLKMEKNINKDEMKSIAANVQKYSEFKGGYRTPEEMRETIHHRRHRYRSVDSEKPRFSKKTPFYQSEEADFVKYFPSDSYYDKMDGDRKMAATRTSKVSPRQRKQSMEIVLEPMQIRTFIVQAKFLD